MQSTDPTTTTEGAATMTTVSPGETGMPEADAVPTNPDLEAALTAPNPAAAVTGVAFATAAEAAASSPDDGAPEPATMPEPETMPAPHARVQGALP